MIATVTKWKYNTFWDDRLDKAEWVRQGTVVERVGCSVKIEFIWQFWVIRFTHRKWFNLTDERYTIYFK